MFRKIPADSNIFQETKKRYINLYEDFKNFSALETKNSGRAKDSKSNRAGSYANYLMRLIIFYEEKYPYEYSTFTTHNDFIKLKSKILNSDFDKYNKDEGRFPNATLNTFERFIEFTESINKKNEEFLINYNVDQTENKIDEDSTPFIIRENTVDYITARKPKLNYNELSFYPRNINESILAKQRSNWKCEYGINHKTFISKSDNNQYMESHHLIPMAYQGLFEYTIDFADNIICLCPTCHRMIHSATDDVKKDMILKFFNQRQYLYPKYGIKVDVHSLLNMYGI